MSVADQVVLVNTLGRPAAPAAKILASAATVEMVD